MLDSVSFLGGLFLIWYYTAAIARRRSLIRETILLLVILLYVWMISAALTAISELWHWYDAITVGVRL